MIPVTRPFLPPKEEYEQYLDQIWEKQWLTNMGPLANELELKLKNQLQVKRPLFVSNGTIALQMAIKSLGLKGQIITTPFSFVATTSSIVWEGCTPVFVDIDSNSLNIDDSKIEAAITSETSAILATHVYGNPCNVEAIQAIADKYYLKVIYDAAHAFGVQLNGKSIFEFGDISTCSLHATKLYHTVEGGLIFTGNQNLHEKLRLMRNFGFAGSENFAELGINGKNCELHAAMGLANLKYIREIHEKRKKLAAHYQKSLYGQNIIVPEWNKNASKNYAYYPVIFESEQIVTSCLEVLEAREIQARRYFYPSLAKVLPYLPKRNMPVTEDIAKRVICLPLYYELSFEDVDIICNLIKKNHKDA